MILLGLEWERELGVRSVSQLADNTKCWRLSLFVSTLIFLPFTNIFLLNPFFCRCKGFFFPLPEIELVPDTIWRRANAIQSLQLSLPLSVIIYLAAKQYSCVTWYINCTTLRTLPRESLFVPSTPDLMPEKFFDSFPLHKGYFCFVSSENVFCSYMLNWALYRASWRMCPWWRLVSLYYLLLSS